MAAGIPYSPFPEESPSGAAAPMQSLDTPAESFGGGLAQSAQKMGATLEDIGQRQFAQAVKFQEMQNRTWADDASTDFAKELGGIQNDYRTLQGLNRTNALPEYQDRVQKLYLKYANSAKSPSAQMDFRTVARGYADRTLESFGTLAAEAGDKARDSAARGSVETAKASAVNNFGLVDHRNDIDNVINRASDYADYKGWQGDDKIAYVQQQTGAVYKELAAARIAVGDTAGARTLLDEATAARLPGTNQPLMSHTTQLSMLNDVERREDYDQRHKNDAQEAADRAIEKAKKETAEAAGDAIFKKMTANPYSVTNNDIANAPMTWEQKERMTDILHEHQTRSGDGLEGKHGPGFWDAYKGVTAEGAGRISDPFDIYRRAGPKGDLSLQDADKLVTIMNQRKTSDQRGDGDAAASADFYKYAHRQIVPFQTNESEDAYHKWFQAAHAQDMKLKAEGKTAEQRYNEDSPDYIGKGLKAAAPAPDDASMLDNAKPTSPSWWSYIFGAPPASTAHVNITTPDSLRAAVNRGDLSPAQGIEEGRKRGWIAPAPPLNQPTLGLPAVPNAR